MIIKTLFFSILVLISFIGTFFIKKIASKKSIVDIPNERSSHAIATPRGGGLAINIAWYIGITIFYFLGNIDSTLYSALISGILLAIVSLVDDIYDISPKFRLLFQFCSAGLALYFLGGLQILNFGLFEINNLFILSILAFFGIVWFINLYNFMDGIDAFASNEGILIALGIFILTGNNVLLVLVFSIGGFLYWNWPRAKIFMGDVGSTQIGFVLMVFGIYFQNTHEVSIWNWFILSSVFWFDATLTLIRRLLAGEKISQAHKKHAYQRLNQFGLSHLKINFWATSINALLIILVVVNTKYLKIHPLFLLILVTIGLYSLTKKIDTLFPFKKDV